jgi:hypothetical protein
MRCAGHESLMTEIRNSYRILVGNLEGKKQFGRPRHGWDDNIKMHFKEVECKYVDWIILAQDMVE